MFSALPLGSPSHALEDSTETRPTAGIRCGGVGRVRYNDGTAISAA